MSCDKRLAGKSVALYFAGEWCPMCRAFTPSLREYYQKHKNDIQVVFVPSDETAEAADRHFEASQGSWLALRFGDPLVKRLKLQHARVERPRRGEFGMAKRRAGYVARQPRGEPGRTCARQADHDKRLEFFRRFEHTTATLGRLGRTCAVRGRSSRRER